ncbi:MAG: hypothetical protein IT378_14600 [Sandaracinaceae bacterium]|nr:hypothetical protein [Sandaracinaceae bacterium]
MAMLTVRPVRRREWRLVVPQITPWSCAAASTVDALVDLLGSDQGAAESAQSFLVERLQLRTQASPLEWVADEVHRELSDERLADQLGIEVRVFDPAAQGRRVTFSMGALRERFERWGSQALLLHRRQ